MPVGSTHSSITSDSGISKLAQQILVEDILSPYGRGQFLIKLHSFPFPPGWGRLQSPITSLETYQIQEHARASITFPLLLRRYMTIRWINPRFYDAASVIYADTPENTVNSIVLSFCAIAKSNSLLAIAAGL
ncbi:hypothetical protein N7461_002962 [Penicillium sp. DV-2018c]|nr:hypothetical protein N7461_002962 [Penicillium sp. DV-2018c]